MARLNHLLVLMAVVASPAVAAAASGDQATGARDYVLGRHAWSVDELGRASTYFAGALASDPNDPVLLRRTFELALAAGDQALALRLANQLARGDRYDTTIGLLRVAEAVQRKDWKTADAVRADLAQAGFAAFAAPIIEAWILVGRRRETQALALLDPAGHDGFAKAYTAEHRAHILAAAGRWRDAAEAYATLLSGEGSRVARLRLAAASAYQKVGRSAEARRVLEESRNGSAEIALARLAAGKDIDADVTDPRTGIALLFARLSADLSREKPLPIALVMARLATFLAPQSADAWLVTADVLARSSQPQAALAALDRVADKDEMAPLARARRAMLLEQLDRPKEALGMLEATARGPAAGMEDWARLGEAYARAERHSDAAAAFDRALMLAPAGAAERWYLFFARGSARERSGDWVRGEADLRQALALAPAEAAVLNYLGYAMLDRGERLSEATQLIEKAVAAKPDDGYIIDSLGWAHFLSGRYADAVKTLERAVAEVPDDPTISEHLGDAYWKVGRRLEARFRWQSALDAGPDGEAKRRIAAKLDFGLDAATLAARKP